MSNFLKMVAEELAQARGQHAPLNSAHEALAVIWEELDEFKAEVWKKSSQRDRANMLKELIQIAAMCARAAEDLGLLIGVELAHTPASLAQTAQSYDDEPLADKEATLTRLLAIQQGVRQRGWNDLGMADETLELALLLAQD